MWDCFIITHIIGQCSVFIHDLWHFRIKMSLSSYLIQLRAIGITFTSFQHSLGVVAFGVQTRYS